jgi:hypothetical protein
MRFVVYDDEVAGSALWDSGNMNVAVEAGLFNVKLGVDHADFDGQALWLSIIVDGEILSPRQEILPAPYALSLRPGADVVGDSISAGDAVLAGHAPATGTALYAEANGGVGLFGDSANNYGVQGSSDASWGGYFTSNEGYGIVASTSGTDHWDHAGTFQAGSGYGVYVTSSGNMAIRGEAGDVGANWQPVGNVGVVGIGQSRGLYGSAGSSYGLYATSLNWYGVYGRTSRSDDNYGLYTPDNFFSKNVNMAGALMNVAQNGGEEALESGDVVVFSGISRPLSTNGSPVIQVARVTEANSRAVAGVVHSRFNVEVTGGEDRDPDPDMEVTPAGPVPPGEYMLVVVQGPAQVKVDAVGSGAIQPGDLLSTHMTAGLAGKAATVTVDGVETTVPGTVFAKALEPLDGKQEMIYVYVTLQ